MNHVTWPDVALIALILAIVCFLWWVIFKHLG